MMSRARWWPLAAGLIALAAIHAGLATRISTVLTQRYLQREAEVTQEFLSSILADEGTAADLFTTPAPSAALTSFGAHVRSLPGIVRANIYAPDGFIRHSTEANLIGVHFQDNAELAESFNGKLVANLEDFSKGKDEHIALNAGGSKQLIEAYIPVTDEAGKIAAVVEFYRRDTVIGETAANITRMVWIAAAASGLVLALMFWLMTRTGRRS